MIVITDNLVMKLKSKTVNLNLLKKAVEESKKKIESYPHIIFMFDYEENKIKLNSLLDIHQYFDINEILDYVGGQTK